MGKRLTFCKSDKLIMARYKSKDLFIDSFLSTQYYLSVEPRRETLGFANDKGADPTAHRRRLISAFSIFCFESIISTLATGKISIF